VPVDDLVRRILDEEIERLETGQSFHIVEFRADKVVVWAVHRDKNGTPRAECWPALPVDQDEGTLRDDPRVRRLADGAPVVFVRSSPKQPPENVLELFRGPDPDPRILDCTGEFEDALRDSIKDSPLAHFYELVLLRRTVSGRLYFDPIPLFAPETRRPATATVRVRCLRGDERGTVFAIVTTQGARGFELMSLSSADLAPGDYQLTVELVRPGLVRIDGLPPSAKLRDDHRTWSELLDSVPSSVAVSAPVHVIVLIEVAGSRGQLIRRADQARELIQLAQSSDAPLRASLISYGAHSFERQVADEAAAMLVWAASGAEVLAGIDALKDYQPVADDYPYAAQLECALALLRPGIRPEDGRPVIVIVGSRPPFPPRLDPRMNILPCPSRNDWRQQLAGLRHGHPDLAVGVIRDQGAPDQAFWQALGRVTDSVSDAPDWSFAMALGIGVPPVSIPFPLAVPEGQ
jgi:hypothetical protein